MIRNDNHASDDLRCMFALSWRLPNFVSRFMAVAIVLFVGTLSLHSQQAKPTEYQVKAAYLYNFGKFVQWPAGFSASQNDSFIICVLGEDPFGPTLNATLRDETIAGKNVVARRIPKPEDALDCRILFISSSEDKQLKQILTLLDRNSILTVSDLPQFSQRGGMVQFVLEGSKVRFEVNLTPVKHAGLTLSSELLKLALSVNRNPQSGD